jgi:glycerol transport system substrate-binding protein
MKMQKRPLLTAVALAAALLIAPNAFADAAAAKRWIDAEFQPSVLSTTGASGG